MDRSRRFCLTPLSMPLRSRDAHSVRDLIVVQLGEEAYRAWGELMKAVRTGASGFDHAFGVGVWEYRACHAEYAERFDAAMSNAAAAHIEAVLAAYPFSRLRNVVDLGGGAGTLLIALLSAYPGMEGVLFDLPHVVERARTEILNAGLTARCEVRSGDLFAGVPEGADGYILSRVIHDWDDVRALAILRNCRRAMPQHGKLLLIERILPVKGEPFAAARAALVSDLMLMVMNGGRERTGDQYRTLLAASGLELVNIVPTATGMSVIEAEPVKKVSELPPRAART